MLTANCRNNYCNDPSTKMPATLQSKFGHMRGNFTNADGC